MVLIFTDNEILNKDLNKNIENSRVVYYPDYILEEKEANVLIEGLSNQINPFILRRKKTDVVKELPEKIENNIFIQH